ncbi:MAG: hypothetical protein IRZ16_09715 [Myxococcaceae bacterium]|nr:hypothetical protein [Myxococcaceae bacterium]
MRHANLPVLVRLLLAAWLMVLPTVAFASSSKAAFNRLVKEAERLYATGKYKESAEKLIEAYPYDPNPRIIYNIARAYDQAGELELSLEYYQRYVGSTEGTDPTLLKRSALAIDRLRGLIAQRDEARKKQAEEQARIEAEAKAAKARAAEEAAAKQRAEEELRAREQAAAEARARAQRNGKIAGFALGGVAVAGMVSGTIFGLNARASRNAFDHAETVEDKRRLQSTTTTQALIADASMGVGLVAAVLAVVFYPKGGDVAKTSTEVSLIPAAGGAGVEVRF